MFNKRRKKQELNPDEIFLDSSNLPSFNTQQFEGQPEKAISRPTIYLTLIVFFAIFTLFSFRVGYLQIVKGESYAERSKNNSLNLTPIFPARGNIYDRNNLELVWNNEGRIYRELSGLSHVLGYIGYPNKDELATGLYHHKEFIGRSGVEKEFNQQLIGIKGVKIEEFNALGKLESDHIVKEPISGQDIILSIDAEVQSALYEQIKRIATDRGFSGGAGVIIDVKTGEIIALTSYPEYDPNIISSGKEAEKIGGYFSDKNTPLINRAISGLYTPGSVFKPFMALAALIENIIDPNKVIVSTGALRVPNPYDPGKPTIFKDWRVNGPTNMRQAIAVSSNIYFYQIGGGFGKQKGLGISNIKKYSLLFGLSQKTGINLPGESGGTIPSPEWKASNFDGEPWRLGDTYHTSIGQYGVLVTPIQMARAYALIANNGVLIRPTILKVDEKNKEVLASMSVGIDDFKIIREGLREAVVSGTAKGLNMTEVAVAAKTGTAELGETKEKVNSWVSGFFPYEDPRYAFTIVMEKGARSNTIGGVAVMRGFLDWIRIYKPEYFKGRDF